MCKQTNGDYTFEVWELCPLPRPLLKLEKENYHNFDSTASFMPGPILKHDLCAPNEKQGREEKGQQRLLDNTKVEFGATKDHDYQ